MKKSLIPFTITAALLVLLAELVIVYATNWNIGVSPDTIVYFKVAENIISGIGMKVAPAEPLIHFPPLYPLFLALAGLPLTETLAGARWLHVFLYAVNVLLVMIIVYRQTSGSLVFAVFGALFMTSSLAMLDIHTMAWSEALFLMLILAGYFLLAEFLATQRNYALLVFSAIFVGLACITRYAGVTVIATAFISILLLRKGPVVQRIKSAALHAIISILPLMLWIARNRLTTDQLTDRNVQYHPIDLDRIGQGIATVTEWLLLPESLSAAAKTSLVLVCAGIVFSTAIYFYARHKRTVLEQPGEEFPFFILLAPLFISVYLLTLVISISYFDAHTPLDNRILSPMYPFGLIMFIILISKAAKKYGMKRLFFVPVLLPAILLICQAKITMPYFSFAHENGRMYTGKLWQSSNLMKIVRALPNDIVIYSNGDDAIELLTGKKAFRIPALEKPGTASKNVDFEAGFENMAAKLKAGNGVIVYFNLIDWRWYLPTSDYLSQNLPLRIVYNGQDGTIFQVKN